MAAAKGKTRDKWGSKAEFLLACIGYAVGLGNIWRFPYLCYRSGGGAFLIPYFIMLVFCAFPLLYLEMAVGQLTRVGPVHAIAMLCPIMKGVGISMVILSFFLCTYYNVIIAWALHYFFNSFKNPLPWKFCGDGWSDELCLSGVINDTTKLNDTEDANGNSTVQLQRESASFQYYYNHVLKISDGLEDGNGFNGTLVGYLFLAWVLCYLCIFKGVRSVGKVVYVTALFPYLVLFILLVRSVTLPGANDGLRYFLVPDWIKLLDPNVWLLAAVQIFGSVGISYGSLIAFSSYNDKQNNIFLDTLAISIINSLTSLLAGCVVFSALGGAAYKLGVDVPKAVLAGPDLVFVAIPPLFVDLPGSNVWAVLFFLMLTFLGIDSQFSMVEVINTTIIDHFGWKGILKNIRWKKETVSLVVCLTSFLFGLIHVTRAGMYYFTLVDNYAVYVPVIFVSFFEVMAICWFFGGNRLAREISFLSGHRASYFFPFCWVFISPVLISAITLANIIKMKPVQYGDYVYPIWAHLIGVFIAVLALVWIPIGALHELYKNGKGSFYGSLIKSITPTFIPEHVARKSSDEKRHSSTEGSDGTEETGTPESHELLTRNNSSEKSKVAEQQEGSYTPPPKYEEVKEI